MIDPKYDDDDFDEEGETDVDEYPIPPGLAEAWEEITREERNSKKEESGK